MKINIKKLSEDAVIPQQAHSTDAGYDLYSIESLTLNVGERRPIKTGIAIAIPEGYYGRVAPRSGLAVKRGIDIMAGVVDSGYRGEIMAVLINLGQLPVEINKGDKIAQIIIEDYYTADFNLVDDLDVTERNTGGFGDSDKKELLQG